MAKGDDEVSAYMRRMKIVNRAKRVVERRMERESGLPAGSVKILTGKLGKAMKSRFIAGLLKQE